MTNEELHKFIDSLFESLNEHDRIRKLTSHLTKTEVALALSNVAQAEGYTTETLTQDVIFNDDFLKKLINELKPPLSELPEFPKNAQASWEGRSAMTFGCLFCGSARLESIGTIGTIGTHERRRCRSCDHEHIGDMLVHDSYCCDRIHQKGGGAAGSTEESRARHRERVAELAEAVQERRGLRLSEVVFGEHPPRIADNSPSFDEASPSESSPRISLLSLLRKLVRRGA